MFNMAIFKFKFKRNDFLQFGGPGFSNYRRKERKDPPSAASFADTSLARGALPPYPSL
jgi:hypothetical protein